MVFLVNISYINLYKTTLKYSVCHRAVIDSSHFVIDSSHFVIDSSHSVIDSALFVINSIFALLAISLNTLSPSIDELRMCKTANQSESFIFFNSLVAVSSPVLPCPVLPAPARPPLAPALVSTVGTSQGHPRERPRVPPARSRRTYPIPETCSAAEQCW